jgi:hypothetical protein
MGPMMQTCSKLKDDLRVFLDHRVRVQERPEGCVVTLPIETEDKRKVSVVVESRDGVFVVHDGGKTLSELFCHGVALTDTRLAYHNELALRHGVHFKNKMIRTVVKQEGLERAIFAVAQCSSMAMVDLVSHKAKFDDDPVPMKVSSILDRWKPDGVMIAKNVDLHTPESDHRLNAVCRAANVTVGIKVLGYDSPKKNAQQYGYMDLDLRQSEEYSHWTRFAIVSGAEHWSDRLLSLVKRHSSYLLEVDSKHEDESLGRIPGMMDDMIRAGQETIQ